VASGRLPEAGEPNAVVVGEAFAEAHGFAPAQVLGGLAENDRVILHPPDTLGEGTAVSRGP